MKRERDPGARKGDPGTAEISREFDFPRETVFRMFTDAKKAATFWGPEEAVTDLFEIDPRPGGVLRIHHRHADGPVTQTTGTIVEIVPPERLVFRSATAPEGSTVPFEALQSLTFESLGPRRTRIIARVKVLDPGDFPGGAAGLLDGFKGGWGQTFDRLRRALA